MTIFQIKGFFEIPKFFGKQGFLSLDFFEKQGFSKIPEFFWKTGIFLKLKINEKWRIFGEKYCFFYIENFSINRNSFEKLGFFFDLVIFIQKIGDFSKKFWIFISEIGNFSYLVLFVSLGIFFIWRFIFLGLGFF